MIKKLIILFLLLFSVNVYSATNSGIDETKPATGSALTANVRANFLAAKNEIEAHGYYLINEDTSLQNLIDTIGAVNPATILVSELYTLTVNTTTTSNIELRIVNAGVIDDGDDKTLTIIGPWVAPAREVLTGFQDDATVTDIIFGPASTNYCTPKWFGGTGAGGAKDDLAAIQACIHALPNEMGKILSLDSPLVNWQVSDTIDIGIFSVESGTNEVQGFARAKFGMIVEGNMGKAISDVAAVKWIGADQPATTKSTINPTGGGSYELITDAKAIFSVVAGREHVFRNLYLNGDNGSGGNAYHGIYFDGNMTQVTIKNMQFDNLDINIRFGTQWDHENDVAYTGYMGDTDNCSLCDDATNAGGWQLDNVVLESIILASDELTGMTLETAQGLAHNYTTVDFNGENLHSHLRMMGGRIALHSCNFNGETVTTSDVWMISGVNKLDAKNVHSESDAPFFITTSTTSSSPVINISGPGTDVGGIDLQSGGAYLTINNAILFSEIDRHDANNSPLFITMHGGKSEGLNIESHTADQLWVDIKNHTITDGGNLFTGSDAGDYIGCASEIVPSSAIGSVNQVCRNGKTDDTRTVDYSLIVKKAVGVGFYTGDPCGSVAEGTIWYNDTSDYMCFCDGGGVDKKVSDNGACF